MQYNFSLVCEYGVMFVILKIFLKKCENLRNLIVDSFTFFYTPL